METKYLTIIPFLVLSFLSKEINSQNLQKKEFIKDLYKISNGFDKLKKNDEIQTQSKFRNFTYLIAETINSQIATNNSNLEGLDIISDSQLKSENKFIAEGNVQIKKNNMQLKSDKLIYDLEKKIITITGEIKFISNEQFFEASKIQYDLISKEGFIQDLYGTVDFQKIDLNNFNNTNSELKNSQDLQISIKDVKLNESSSFESDDITAPQTFKLEINNMKKWRMQSEEIKIKGDIWSAKVLYLTNDPFNKPQIIIKNKNFKSFEKDGKLVFQSGWSSIILEDKLHIPLGRIKYNQKESNNFKWGLGYDKNNKDGIYIERYTDPIKIGRKTDLKLKKEFYIQRFFQGNTKSFSKENESVLAEKSKQESKLSDYFGISSELNSKLLGLDFNSEIKFNSLDLDKFKKIISMKGELSRELYSYQDKDKDEKTKISLFGTYRDKVWNGSLGEKDILTAYGLILKNKKNWEANKVEKSSKLAVGFGEFQSQKKSSVNNIISRERLNLLWEREHNYHIWSAKDDFPINKEFNYSPEPINKGIDLSISSKVDLYSYSDGNFQNLITFKAGPKITLGNFKNKYFDYSEINILGKTTIANGESPFDFDQSVDNHSIEIGLKQQLIGPLVLNYSTEYNLDINSNNFHEFSNNKYELSWNRRAFNVGIFYNEDRKLGGINFEINGFNFSGYGEKFK